MILATGRELRTKFILLDSVPMPDHMGLYPLRTLVPDL